MVELNDAEICYFLWMWPSQTNDDFFVYAREEAIATFLNEEVKGVKVEEEKNRVSART